MDNSLKGMNRRQFIKVVGAGAALVALGNCSGESNSPPGNEKDIGNGENSGKSKVYFTSDISPAGLMLAYNALNQQPSGNVAVKLSVGERVSNYLRPALIGGLVQSLSGTIVECNTLYGGPRDNTATHKEIARAHGYYDIANVDILDENGSMTLPVRGGTRLQENKVGKNFANYDYFVVLSHFKGHTMGGFGGALKNISIGIASRDGKEWIHKGGNQNSTWTAGGVPFLEAMAEAGKSVVDKLNGKILYINVMNQLSVDCDCFDNPKAPEMSDIGILSSLNPVALDQACVHLVYDAPNSGSLIERMESRNGIRTIEHAAEIGLGSREYELINL
jgi:uncharacterized Fe-S center protein